MSTADATMLQPSMESAEVHHHPVSNFLDTSCRKVKFACNIQEVFPVLSRREYSNSELRKCFYTPDDRIRIEAERQRGVKELEKGSGKNQLPSSSLRGLESQTREGSRQSQKRIWAVIDSVLAEQDNQSERDAFDCNKIAATSRCNSKESALLALRAGISDQHASFSTHRNSNAQECNVAIPSGESPKRPQRRKSLTQEFPSATPSSDSPKCPQRSVSPPRRAPFQ